MIKTAFTNIKNKNWRRSPLFKKAENKHGAMVFARRSRRVEKKPPKKQLSRNKRRGWIKCSVNQKNPGFRITARISWYISENDKTIGISIFGTQASIGE